MTLPETPTLPPAAPAPRKRGRKLTAGRFDTREELVEFVWRDWEGTGRNQSDIARAARVSQGVVGSILDGPRPASLPPRRQPAD